MLNYLKKCVIDNEKRLDQLKQDINKYGIIQGDMVASILVNEIEHVDLKNKLTTFAVKTAELIEDFKVHQEQYIEMPVNQWKFKQQTSLGKNEIDDHLDSLQAICDKQAGLLGKLKSQIKNASQISKNIFQGQISILDCGEKIKQLITNLLSCSFIIDKQPEQVIRSYRSFNAGIRLLLNQSLNLHINKPLVKVLLIKEKHARKIITNNLSGLQPSKILDSRLMDYQVHCRKLFVEFPGLKMKNSERGDPDCKYSLLFQTDIEIDGDSFTLFTISLPIVIISHHSQEPNAWATIHWDNQFSSPCRLPFDVPEEVPIQSLIILLSRMFEAYVGRALTEDQSYFLAHKALRCENVRDWSGMTITWSLLAQEPLPERRYTFWEWFYAVLRMCQNHLRDMWNEGLIIGFVERKHCLERLHTRPVGTFIIKVSEFIKLGAVTVVWVGPQQRGCRLYSLKPYTTDDMEFRKLPELIRDLQHLTHLFPDIAKDRAFAKYYTTVSEAKACTSADHHYVELDFETVNKDVKTIDKDVVHALSRLTFKNTFDEISMGEKTRPLSVEPNDSNDLFKHLFDI